MSQMRIVDNSVTSTNFDFSSLLVNRLSRDDEADERNSARTAAPAWLKLRGTSWGNIVGLPRYPSVVPIGSASASYDAIFRKMRLIDSVTKADKAMTEMALEVSPASTAGNVAGESILFPIRNQAVQRAEANLFAAYKAADQGDLRTAYREVFLGLDEFFRLGMWTEVAAALGEICGGKYPPAFGIGAMRFASDAARFIPGWSRLLRDLSASAETQGMDIRRAMRGLLTTDEDK